MRRTWPAFAFFSAGLVALIHCGDTNAPSSESGGGGTEAGTLPCGSTRSCTGSSGGGGSTSSGSSGQGSSGGGGGGDGGGGGTSSSSGAAGSTRIQTTVGLPTSSAACGNTAPPNRGEQRWNNGRYYLPYQPYDYSNTGPGDGKGYPVLVALHGCYGDPSYFANNFGSFQDAVGSEAVLIYGAAQNAASSCGWDVGGQTDVGYLDGVIADVAAQFCIDQSRVFLLGFSWGGYMAQYYSCNRPGIVKAMVGGAGGWPDWQSFTGMDPSECGQIPSLIYGRTHDNDEQVGRSQHARDKRVEVNACGAGQDSAVPFDPARPNPPAEFGSVARCIDYPSCANGVRTTYCEDPKNLTDPDIGGEPSWNHTIWQPYHRPIWEWLRDLP